MASMKSYIVAMIVAVLAMSSCSQKKPEPQPTPSPTPAPTPAPGPVADPAVVRITTIKNGGGRVDWSAQNLIAFDQLDSDNYYDVFVMNPDGTGERCLTCNRPALPNRHMGNPAWHPSGDYIVFQVQKANAPPNPLSDWFANPGAGINNDIWVMDAQGTRYWQLTNVPISIGGVLHPHFSRSGDRLLWSERVGTAGPWGEWALRVADFQITPSGVRIANVRTYQPGVQRRMYESHGFTPDGGAILFSGNLEEGQSETAADIYRLELQTGAVTNLTSTMNQWDEHAQISPNGEWIVWMSSMGVGGNPNGTRTDYWLMRSDGSSKRQITFMHEPGKPEYVQGNAAAADSSWSPDGSRLLAYVLLDGSSGKSQMLMLDFSVALGTGEAARPSSSMTAVPVALSSTDDLGLYELSRTIDRMARDQQLLLASVTPDPLLPGRRHERYVQVHDGVPIVGAGVTRQVSETHTYSVFGTLYEDVRGSVTAAFDATEAAERLAADTKAVALAPDQLALVVRPANDRTSWALAYEARVVTADDILMCYLDAHTGALLACRTDLQLWSPGAGSPAQLAGGLPTTAAPAGQSAPMPDAQRRIVYDLRGEPRTTLEVLTTSKDLSWIEAFRPAPASDLDVAAATADAAVRISMERLIARLGWNPFGNDPPIVLVHPNDWEAGAGQPGLFTRGPFYAGRRTVVLPDGPEQGATGRAANSIAVMAHELGHAVIDVTSRLLYRGESGALNEAFAHIMSEAAVARSSRIIAGPAMREGSSAMTRAVLSVFDAVADPPANHHRTDAERVFMRTFTLLLPSDATVSMARTASLQSARDLSVGHAFEARLAAAWRALDVPSHPSTARD
jgi:Tol biopolymer transport system component